MEAIVTIDMHSLTNQVTQQKTLPIQSGSADTSITNQFPQRTGALEEVPMSHVGFQK